MYSEILKYIKDYLPTAVTVEKIQTGYLGDFQNVDLRIPAILLEPKTDRRSSSSTRWNKADFLIKVWIMIPFDLSFENSMDRMEKLLAADGSQDGVQSAINKLKKLDAFRALAGTSGGQAWRVDAPCLSYNNVTFSISQRASEKINIAQFDLIVSLKVEA